MDTQFIYLWSGLLALFFTLIEFLRYISQARTSRLLTSFDSVLLITAHPDDECMFFAPTVLRLCQLNIPVHLLCLSRGDFYGLGHIRQEEIVKSCELLGIARSNCHVVNDPRLPDDASVTWHADHIQEHVLTIIQQTGVKTLLTFDDGGVSGHKNHRDVSQAIRKLIGSGAVEKRVQATEIGESRVSATSSTAAAVEDAAKMRNSTISAYSLETVGVLRKYIGIFDIPFSAVLSQFYVLADWSHIVQGQQAMFAHWSQMQWFRVLYIVFSRYMSVNTLRMMETCTDTNQTDASRCD